MNVSLADPERALAAAGGAATVAGGWVMAQAAAIDSPLEVVGGGILAVVGVVALRMVIQASRHSRDLADGDEARLVRRLEDLEADIAAERQRSARLLVAYDRERQLRISFEAAGLHDRRHQPDELTAGLVNLHDRDELADELAQLGDTEIPDTDPEGL